MGSDGTFADSESSGARDGGDRGDGGLHVLANQLLHLSPQMRVALTLHVAGSECAIGPGRRLTLDWIFLIVEAIVTENFCLRVVRRSDLGAAMDEAVRLV